MKLRVIVKDMVKYCFICDTFWSGFGMDGDNSKKYLIKNIVMLELNKIELHKKTIAVRSL